MSFDGRCFCHGVDAVRELCSEDCHTNTTAVNSWLDLLLLNFIVVVSSVSQLSDIQMSYKCSSVHCMSIFDVVNNILRVRLSVFVYNINAPFILCLFLGEPGLAGFIGAKDDGSRHHQQTNTQLFTGQMPFLSPIQQCQSTVRIKVVEVLLV